MARLRAEVSVDRDEHSTIIHSSSRAASYAPRTRASASPASSDKENPTPQMRAKNNMGPPLRPQQSRGLAEQPNKRRRTGSGPVQRDTSVDEDDAEAGQDEENMDTSPDGPVYDPNQDVIERQKIRKGLRMNERDIHDLGGEWLNPESDGLRMALEKQDRLYNKVKQTSDATIDSRFLVKAADLASKKTKNAALGDGSSGVDVDDFISKCIIFMRKGDDDEVSSSRPASTQVTSTQRRRRRTDMDSDDEDGLANDGDAHNWAWFGSRACYAATRRPCVPGFLLGPLSVQKRARALTQRRARQEKRNPEHAVKPKELDASTFKEQDNSGVSQMCKMIYANVQELYKEADDAAENAEEEEFKAVCERTGALGDGGISLFRLAIDPHSFGQTVENLFYVSFLIKDGLIGVDFDDDGQPSLHPHQGGGDEQEQARDSQNAHRYQAVLGIDFDDWKALVEAYDIKECLIGHREEERASNGVGASGWYGS